MPTFVEEQLAGLTCAVRASRDARAPVLLGLHGRGSSPDKRFGSAIAFGEGFTHVLPRGPIRYEEGFAWYIKGDEMDAHVTTARAALLGLCDALRARYPGAPLLVWGFSQGGLMAIELQIRAAEPFERAVSMGGKIHQPTAADAKVMANVKGRSLLLVHGTEDTLAPLKLSKDAKAALDAAGARVDFCELPIGHEIEPLTEAAVRGYLSNS